MVKRPLSQISLMLQQGEVILVPSMSIAGNIYCWGNGSDGALADNSSAAHNADDPAFAKAVGGEGILSVGTFKKSYYRTSAGLEIEKAQISTLGTYPHQVTPFDSDNSQYTFYSDSKCESKIGSSNSNSAFDLPSDVERIYFQKGNLGCSVSYATYGFDRIPPSSPVSLIPSVVVESDQPILFEVEGLAEGDHFGAFSDANCTDPLTEKIVAIGSTKEGNIPPQLSDFTLYGQFYDATGNPGSCERLQEVTVLNQRSVPIFGVSEQQTFVGPRINGGSNHTCIVTGRKKIDCWGIGDNGQLGDDTAITRGYPSHVIANDDDPDSKFNDAIQVVAGHYHSCAQKEDGTVYCWGLGKYLGINSTSGSLIKDYPVSVTDSASNNLSDIIQISSFYEHTCALNESGNVHCWGRGQYGEIGNGSTNFAARATLVVEGVGSSTALAGISEVSAGGDFTCALKTDGGVLCWGNNKYGQLGNGQTGTSFSKSHPVVVIDSDNTATSGISALALGYQHGCALTNVGKVLCWGRGTSGRLGNDGTSNRDHPAYVVDGDNSSTHLTGIVQVSSSGSSTCALNESSNVYCWGSGSNGKLGNDASDNKDHPVHVVETDGNSSSMLSDVVQIGSGYNHTCALKKTGKALCWGNGEHGPLGDNEIASHSVDHPVSVVTSSSDANPYELGNFTICKNNDNGNETCSPTPSLPTFITDQLAEDGC